MLFLFIWLSTLCVFYYFCVCEDFYFHIFSVKNSVLHMYGKCFLNKVYTNAFILVNIFWNILTQIEIQEKVMCVHSFFTPWRVQPSPLRRDERPVSCYTPSSNSHTPSSMGSAGRDPKDKPRSYMPSLVNNETYGAVLNAGSTQPVAAPPLPPRNLGKIRFIINRQKRVGFYTKKLDSSLESMCWMFIRGVKTDNQVSHRTSF